MSNITNSVKPLDIINAINDAYTDIGGKQDELVSGNNIKTVNSASILGSGDLEVASANQGTKADTAIQPEDISSTYSSTGTAPVNGTAVAQALSTLDIPEVDQTYLASSTNPQSGTAVAEALIPITTVIPSAASSTNQLADKNFVNSSISTNTATFRGTFASVEALNAYSGEKTNNDYAFVETTDGIGNTYYDRYKYNGTSWVYEFEINNTSFTSGQWAAINSGVNETVVSKATSALQMDDVVSVYTSTGTVPVNGTAVAQALATLDIPEVDQTYSASSTSPQSGTAVAGALLGMVPSQTGQSGKFLSTDGTVTAWETVDALPSQSGQSGKFLTTDGTIASWATAQGGPVVVDESISSTSTNPVQNKVIYSALNALDLEKEDILKAVNVLTTSGALALEDNSINSITPSGNIAFTLPTVTDNTKFHQILVQINLVTVYSIDLGLGATPHYFNLQAPDLSQAGVYNLVYEYDKANQYWVAGVIEKGV